MAREGIKYESVVQAAMRLLSRGENPSIERVRKELGDTGSKTTIGNHLNTWRALIDPRALEILPPELPAELIEPLKSLWGTAVSLAAADYSEASARAERLVAEAKAQAQGLAAQLDKANAAIELHTHQIKDGALRIEELTAALDESKAQVKAERDNREHDLARHRVELDLAKKETDRVRVELQGRLTEATERVHLEVARAEAQQNHWATQVDETRQTLRLEREAAEQRIGRLHGDLDLANHRERASAQRASQAEEALGAARDQAEALRIERDEARYREEQARRALVEQRSEDEAARLRIERDWASRWASMRGSLYATLIADKRSAEQRLSGAIAIMKRERRKFQR